MPATKRTKLGGRAQPPLDPALLAAGSRARYSESYNRAAPFAHAMLEPLCVAGSMEKIKEEVTRHLRAEFKETDLFKLYQTIDLANLSSAEQPAVRELCANMPELLALRGALYAPEFREFIRDLTGCPELTDRVDMAASIYTQGCHLLCHDDVIGTRAVSFIVYLTDSEWSASDGGALQLYPLEGQSDAAPLAHGIPTASPTTDVLPRFNSMAIFAVKPGLSYHSVQEVYTERTPRLSIQGWYHAAAAPDGSELASLSQLKAIGTASDRLYAPLAGATAQPPHPEAEVGAEAESRIQQAWALSDEDRCFLSEWVQPAYLQPPTIAKVRQQFADEGAIQLQRFLKEERAAEIGGTLTARDDADFGTRSWPRGPRSTPPAYDIGVTDPAREQTGSGGWSAVGPAHVQRFLQWHDADADIGGGDGVAAAATTTTEPGRVLSAVVKRLLTSPAFARLIYALTGVRALGALASVRMQPAMNLHTPISVLYNNAALFCL